MKCPKLRPVEAIPVEAQGRQLMALRDPLGIAREVVAIPMDLCSLLSLFDGETTYLDAQAEYVRKHGTLLFTGQIENLVRQLDENFLLENDRYRERLRSVQEDFRRLSVRPATCTPNAYSADPEECREQFEEFLGPARGTSQAGVEGLVGLVAPHVDIARGKKVYGSAYALAERASDVELFVIFGTCHAAMKNLFALTEKDWITPFGKIPADKRLIRAILSRSETDFLEDEFAHKAEHSIEIQVAILSYLRRERPGFSIVPILCGSFDELVAQGGKPAGNPQLRDFLASLDEVLAGDKRRRLFLAGADLAHIGPRFGDTEGLSRELLDRAQRADKESLVELAGGGAEAFYGAVAAHRNRYRVCGLGAVYCAASAARPATGRILDYEQWVDDAGTSSVSFASVALYA
ncbi:MAG: AmmeMemoRadiSam system protein B [Planctomycetota bacterium]